MPRGGKRVGAGRPRELVGEGPRLDLLLDESSGTALLAYAQENGVGMREAVRELLTSWRESVAVRKAVAAWRKNR